jgi:3-hydroxyacyl-[acyl-carrier-protein] dehydratase
MKPVKEVLPHREPFLFIDEVIDLTETSIIVKSHVREDGPHFRGHYPGKPIMPGVLLCETVLQAGAYLMASKLELDAGMKGAPVVSRMNKVKFKRMVKPGDDLEVHAALERSIMGAHFMHGSIRSKGKTVMTLEFAVNLAEEESEDGEEAEGSGSAP